MELRINNRRHIRCSICERFPNIIKHHFPRKRLAIVGREGTRYRQNVLEDHVGSKCHQECERAHRIQPIAKADDGKKPSTAMEVCIASANRQKMAHVCKLMMQVYVDAKLLNLTAYSWPARYVCGEASHAYDIEKPSNCEAIEKLNLQYVHPNGHQELLTTIVKSYHNDFMNTLDEAWAVSLSIDGSIDFTQIDKIYLMAKIIKLTGDPELVFIGVGEQKERGALGLKNTVIDVIQLNTGDARRFLSKVSSIRTDGTNVNIGEKAGLWALLDREMDSLGLLKISIKLWCAAHRAELVWKSTGKRVKEVSKLLTVLSSISSYFNQSALRTSELHKIATENNTKVLNLPKIFEIRWSSFTFTLLRNVLFSWKALILYFKKNENNAVCAGYHRYLTSFDNMQLIGFLGDVLYRFQNFQQNLQSDSLTIVSLATHIASIQKSLKGLESTVMLGGFESRLAKKIVTENDGKRTMDSIELQLSSSRQKSRNFSDIRVQILKTLQNSLTDRFAPDEDLLKTVEPFIGFKRDADIETIHEVLAPDLSLANLGIQYEDIVNESDKFEGLGLNEVIKKLTVTAESRKQYKELITVFSRISACTPHSADIERCISGNNRLKTKLRSSLKVETENKYLFVHHNMPDFQYWDPAKAAKLFIDEKIRRDRKENIQSKARAQPHFKGIYGDARHCDEKSAQGENVHSTYFHF